MNCVSSLQSYSSHETCAASFTASAKSLHLCTSVPQTLMQFIFNPDKKSPAEGTCCVHRFSYFINNVKHTDVLHDGSEQLTGCKEASCPHSLTSVTKGLPPQTTLPQDEFLPWCCIATPFPWLEKSPYKLQLSNTELSPSEISLQPFQKMWESRQNKNLQTSHLWRWHSFLLVFRSVQEIIFF